MYKLPRNIVAFILAINLASSCALVRRDPENNIIKHENIRTNTVRIGEIRKLLNSRQCDLAIKKIREIPFESAAELYRETPWATEAREIIIVGIMGMPNLDDKFMGISELELYTYFGGPDGFSSGMSRCLEFNGKGRASGYGSNNT